MLKIPNYNVIVPTVPTVRLQTKRRTTDDGDRNELVYEVVADNITLIELPWQPISPHWVEVYIDGIRLINPRTTSFRTGQQYEVYNVVGNIIKFNQPVTGPLKIICDTAGAHWQKSLIIGAQNVQAYYETRYLYELITRNWPIESGQAVGSKYTVYYKQGPEFQDQSWVFISDCKPSNFNGNFTVISSTEGSVVFQGPTVGRSKITETGSISGFGNLTINSMFGIGLYSEPVIITQPYHGYVRLSTDRKSMAYVPDKNYVGNDTFSWSLINQHGQIGEPKCCNIRVTII